MASGRGWSRWLIWAALAAGTAGAVIAIAGIDTPARVPLVLVFLAVVPALAVTTLLGGLDRLGAVVIAGISTIVVDFAIAETMIISGTWSLRAGAAAVAAVSILIAAAGIAARRLAPGLGR
jgi:hypothetical protein